MLGSPAALILKVAPKALPNYVAAFSGGTAQFAEYGITTPLRMAHFLAQVLHESGGLTKLRESGTYSAKRIVEVFGVGKHSAGVTPAQAAKLAGDGPALFERVYGLGNPKKAAELGNLKKGDAWRCRGGGPMQITGGNLYRLYGFGDDPDAITSAARCLEPALKIWKAKGCNELADRNDIREITRRINGGYNGYADRVAWFNKCWPLLNTSKVAESWKVADASEETKLLQQSLAALGYKLKIDGRIGPKSTAAIVDFQHKNNLRADGIAGELTKAAIAARIAGTAPAIGSAEVAQAPALAPPAAGGLTLAAMGEGGQRMIDQAELLRGYAGLSNIIEWGCLALTVAGVGIVVVGLVRTYVIPAIRPPQVVVPA